MSLPIPNLDEINFDDLVKEARSLIPVYAPEWTNHNPSDPGITLVELFAWLCDMIMYRIDQIPEKNYIRFLNLLGIQLEEGEKLNSGIRRGIEQLSECSRAVTTKDYEILTQKALMEKPNLKETYPDLSVRAICLANKDIENQKEEGFDQFGHVSVILIMSTEKQTELMKETSEIKQYVRKYLSERKILTNRIHVVDPDYQEVRITLQVAANDNKLTDTVREVIEKYIDPITGGEDKKGWPLGRSLYESDIYYLVEGIKGIDHVKQMELEAPEIKSYQLIKLKELIIEVES